MYRAEGCRAQGCRVYRGLGLRGLGFIGFLGIDVPRSLPTLLRSTPENLEFLRGLLQTPTFMSAKTSTDYKTLRNHKT